jgi:DNA-directed RNA polymerase specialized sigma24 family protein
VTRENAEDAWLKFLQRQPDRDGDRWKGWLYVTAKREAWKLNALEFKEREEVPAPGAPDLVDPIDPRDRLSERVEFQAALQELRKLPPLLQEVVVRSQVWRQADVAEAMGLSRQRVAELLVKAALRVSQLNEERHEDERPVASPRAARLRELEDEPPVWLTSAIGMRPARSPRAVSCWPGGAPRW